LQVVKRGEVWLSQLDPARGREIRKTRPCIIVSPPEIHDFLDVAIVAPMTTGSRPAGFRVPIRFAGENGLILLEQTGHSTNRG
jgi:mRNA interferase MazF